MTVPLIDAIREALVASGIATTCREDVDHERCRARAEFVLWGKLFEPEALGPRCWDHAVKWAGHHMASHASQFAVLDLRPLIRVIDTAEERPAPPTPQDLP